MTECERESIGCVQYFDDIVSKAAHLVLTLPNINSHNNRVRYHMHPIIKLWAIYNPNTLFACRVIMPDMLGRSLVSIMKYASMSVYGPLSRGNLPSSSTDPELQNPHQKNYQKHHHSQHHHPHHRNNHNNLRKNTLTL